MKIKYTILAGCLLMMGMASCEMKDEILGNKTESEAMGVMNLNVLVNAKTNDVLTKADGTQDGGTVDVPAVSAIGYTVEISNGENVVKTLNYDPQRTDIELPVGDYSLYAHAQGEPKETEAYYGGRNTVKIEKDKAASVSVICKMMNTKIQLGYDATMQTAFKRWEVLVTAGSKSKLFTYDGSAFAQPDPIFWMMDEGTSEVRVSFKGVNQKGNTVIDNRVITKPNAADNKNWIGGDALAVNIKAKEIVEEIPDGVNGIEITAKVQWDGISDSVDVTVEDDGGEQPEPGPNPEPGQPENNTIEITLPRSTYNLPDDLDKATDVVTFKAKSGLQSLKVIINPGNEAFKGALGAVENQMSVSFADGVEMVGNNEFEETMGLVVPGITVPEKEGVTEYSFPIGNFLEVLNDPDFGPTTAKGHYFKIMATAVGGSEVFSEELYIIVKPAQ